LGGEVVQRPVKQAQDVRAIRESEVVNPSGMIAAGDAGFGIFLVDKNHSEPAGSDNLSWGITHPSAVAYPDNPWSLKRHSRRWNILSVDGHAATLRIRSLFGFRSDDVRRLWNKDDEPHREFPPVILPMTAASDPNNL
jgi:hypothetical protein